METGDDWQLTERVRASARSAKGDSFAAAVRATRMAMIVTDPRRLDALGRRSAAPASVPSGTGIALRVPAERAGQCRSSGVGGRGMTSMPSSASARASPGLASP